MNLNNERNQETIKRFEQLSQLIDSSIPLKYPDYNELTLEGQKVKDNLNNAEEKRDKAVEYNEQVKLHNNRIDTLTEQKAEFIDRQNVLNDAIMSVKSKTVCSVCRVTCSCSITLISSIFMCVKFFIININGETDNIIICESIW